MLIWSFKRAYTADKTRLYYTNTNGHSITGSRLAWVLDLLFWAQRFIKIRQKGGDVVSHLYDDADHSEVKTGGRRCR